MATISGKIAPSNAYTLTMNVTESNINTANNTSVVKVVGTITKSGSYGAQNSNGSSNTVVIDGTSYSYTVPFNLYANNSVQIFRQTKTVTHNSDGSKTINVSWTFNGNIGGSYNPNGTVSGSVKLATIARKSSPSISPTSVTLPSTSGSTAVTINTNRKSSSFTHTIKLTLGGETISTRTGVGASTTYSYSELTNLVMPRTTTTSSATISVSCETFNGSSSLGSNTTSFSVIIGSGAAPSWPAPQWTCLDTNQATIALTGDANLLVQGVSIPVVTITAEQRAEAQYSATMQKYAAQFDGKSYEAAYSSNDVAITLDAPNTHGSQTLSVSAVDSRGLAAIASGPMTVLQYNAPTIDASITRAGGYSSEATLSIAGTYSHSDELANTINTTSGVKYRYKRSSESTWSDWINRPVTLETEVSTYAGEQIVPEKPTGAEAETGKYSALDLVLELASEYQWDIEVSCTDSLKTTTVSLTLPIGRPAFYIGADGRVGVGEIPLTEKEQGENGLLAVDGRIIATGNCYSGTTNEEDRLIKKSEVSDEFGASLGLKLTNEIHLYNESGIGRSVSIPLKWSDICAAYPKLVKVSITGCLAGNTDGSGLYITGQDSGGSTYQNLMGFQDKISCASNGTTSFGRDWLSNTQDIFRMRHTFAVRDFAIEITITKGAAPRLTHYRIIAGSIVNAGVIQLTTDMRNQGATQYPHGMIIWADLATAYFQNLDAYVWASYASSNEL